MATIIKEPNFDFTISSALQTIRNTEQRVLIVGQQSSAGTATSGQLYTQLGSVSDFGTLAGESSMIAEQYRNIREVNGVSRVDAIILSDAGGGTAATGAFTVTGTATEAGTVTLIVGSEQNYTFTIDIANSDTATAIGDTIEAAINANTKCPVTASNSTGTVTLTAVNKGTLGNKIGLVVDGTVAGVSIAITAMASGATDPTLTTVFDVIDGMRYQTILWPYTASISIVEDLLDDRWNVTNAVLDGVAISTLIDSYANVLSALNARNSQSIVYFVDETINESAFKGSSIVELPWASAAQVGGIRALKLTDGANTSSLVVAGTGSNDKVGGMHMASFPYFNMPTDMSPRTTGTASRGWTAVEQDAIKAAGGAIFGNNLSGTEVILGEVATTYKTDSASNPDVTFKYLEYVDTSSACREYFYNNCRARFAQTRLTLGGVLPNSSMVNAATIEAFFSKLYQDLALMSLVQIGETYSQFFKDNLTITIDLSTGSVTASMKLPIVTQLRSLVVDMQITFSTNG
jgi:phage tail sheath gpL-like